MISLLPRKIATMAGTALLLPLGLFAYLPSTPRVTSETGQPSLVVAGVQAEFPSAPEVLGLLDKLIHQSPQAHLLVLSEYTFDGPVPTLVRAWCREKRRFLAVGAKDFVSGAQFYNTIFVIDPHGEIVFTQAKCVPIQFFRDGLPAKEQRVWQSPWGPIGFCICYDLGYRRVVDRLVRLGARALIVPSMDVAEWGAREHELHSRVAPVRAAEYGIPIFRLASSGVSQVVDGNGRVTTSAPYPGEHALIAGALSLSRSGTVPVDRWIALASVGITALLAIGLLVQAIMTGRARELR
jgi:apolipoprotein N-acyltransferase